MQHATGAFHTEHNPVDVQADEPQVFDRIDTAAMDTRLLRRGLRRPAANEQYMPESDVWRIWLELRRRGEPNVDVQFVTALKGLHRRRCVTGVLNAVDPDPMEHRLTDDAYLGELWKAYKRCLVASRTGPASSLLRDLERQLLG
jgi:hypothetical protein